MIAFAKYLPLGIGLLVLAQAVALPRSADAQTVAVVPPASEPAASPDFAPAFLGTYRKVMAIEQDLLEYSRNYGVDASLARAVCMWASGGNEELTSPAGARGCFQLRPETFWAMRVPTSLEAGIKYLGQLLGRFGREEEALAAFAGEPERVAAGQDVPGQSLQFALGVGSYRSILKAHEAAVRERAGDLSLAHSIRGGDFWTLSRRLQVPLIQLRLLNPLLTDASLGRTSQLIAYSSRPLEDLVELAPTGQTQYRVRTGDTAAHIAAAFDVDADRLREVNALGRLQAPLPGTMLTVPFEPPARFVEHLISAREDLEPLAARLGANPWDLVRDNRLWAEQVEAGMVLRVRADTPPVAQASARRAPPAAAPRATAPVTPPRAVIHRVTRGETLASLARRYGTTVGAIQRANALGRRTTIRVGQRLRIPPG